MEEMAKKRLGALNPTLKKAKRHKEKTSTCIKFLEHFVYFGYKS